MYKKLILILFFILNFQLFSQGDETQSSVSKNDINENEVDIKSYKLFSERHWDELIEYGTDAFNKGKSFYYLPIRIGIAYFEKQNYQKASEWFIMSYDNYSDDNFVNEYLYYSLLNNGNYFEADYYAQNFSEDLKDKIHFKESNWLTQININYNINSNTNLDKMKSEPKTDSISNRTLLDKINFVGLDFTHKFTPNLYMRHSFSYIQAKELSQISLLNNVASEADINSKQFQYSLGMTYSFLPFWKSHISANIIDYTKNIISVLAPPTFFLEETKKSTDFVISGGVSRKISNFDIGTSLCYSGLNSNHYLQADANLIYYPLGNLNLYAGLFASFQKLMPTDSLPSKNEIILEPILGFKIYEFWITTSYLAGNISNFVKNDGFLVYNSNYIIKNKLSIGIILPVLDNKFQISAYYHSQNYEGKYYQGTIPTAILEFNNQFKSQSITGGIIWNF
ncbi:MAG: hypothetical protein NTW25_12570 [Candidatus Kapabacteria bacterium]|nr:hypothetical protein [Candidatus Kapabacteria bacterium]